MNSNQYRKLDYLQNKMMSKHTCVATKLLDYASLEFTTAVADSTFLNRMEPVVFFFLSAAWSLDF
jgi:hypothetical protein